MKIVLDTNVFISGIFFSGPPAKILNAWRERKIQFVLSDEILQEYKQVGMILSLKYPQINISRILELVHIYSQMVQPEKLKKQLCDDPDDDKFFACAIAANCRIIVSGDTHLIKESGFKQITVLKPRQFIEKYKIN